MNGDWSLIFRGFFVAVIGAVIHDSLHREYSRQRL